MRKAPLTILACLILLFALPAAAYQPTPENLLFNGDFLVQSSESPLPAGWYYDAWIPEDSDYYTDVDAYGAPVMVLQNIYENDARICQTVAVEPGVAYRFSCEILVGEVAGGAGAGISVMNSHAGSEPLVRSAEDWRRVEFVGVAAENQTQIEVGLRLGGYGALSQGMVRFRNARVTKLEEVPEGAVSLQHYTSSGGGKVGADGPSWGGILMAVLICALLFGGAYALGVLRPANEEHPVLAAQIATVVLLALLLRMALSLIFVGHSTDITCFSAWADAMVEYGPSGFYTSGMFADYPPGYMYILWGLGALRRLFGLEYGSAAFILLLKLPSIAADIVSAYLVYRIACRQGMLKQKALFLFGAVALNPAMAFISGGWGQIDSLLTLGLAAACYLLCSRRLIWAGLVYGVTILIKPQALMAGPLLAAMYFFPDASGEQPYSKRMQHTALAVLAAVSAILLLALPFGDGEGFSWLYEKYFSTATSYPYASVEAFNFFALIGGNWAGIKTVPFLFSYGVWGICFMVLSVAAGILLYAKAYKRNQQGAAFLSMAFLLAALFAMGPYMHERYLFPVLLLLVFAGIYYDDRRLFLLALYFSVTMLFNALCAFYIVDHQEARGSAYDRMTFLGSLLTMLGFGYFVYTAYDIAIRGRTRPTAMFALEEQSAPAPAPAPEPEEAAPAPAPIQLEKYDGRLGFTRRDRLYCWGLTLLYAAFALTNLGSLKAPETEYISFQPGQTLELQFEEETEFSEYWIFGGIAEGTLLMRTDQGEEAAFDQKFDDMFRWKRVFFRYPAKSVQLMTYAGDLRIRELAFFDTEGNYVPYTFTQSAAAALNDEPGTIPQIPGYFNGMYFDELYHARTAYEHLHGMDPYENSHPPLGKVFIMLGIAIFGMNPFGWRIVGALFGIGMVPILYAFGKRLFGKSELALLAAGLFAFDFMHFTQTRIATIDVYGVFFIILMFYYMYQYYCMSFYTDGLKATLKPLGLAGLFFGLGAASKWICIYAGGGLAVLLALSLFRRYREHRAAIASGDAALIEKTRHFWKLTIQTLAWCCLFYIAVPVVIYVFSYMPYFFSVREYSLKDVWQFQEYMYSYHSNLNVSHPFQSSWWEWPFTMRPMWYFMGEGQPDGMISTMTASGNPAVWWVCSVLSVALVVQLLRGKIKLDRGMTVAFVGIVANFLPWVLVSRCIFIYHFFATVPFIILCGVYVLKHYEEKNPRLRWVKWAWLGACLLLFLLMYPGISGYPVPIGYARFLQGLPGGNLFYGA